MKSTSSQFCKFPHFPQVCGLPKTSPIFTDLVMFLLFSSALWLYWQRILKYNHPLVSMGVFIHGHLPDAQVPRKKNGTVFFENNLRASSLILLILSDRDYMRAHGWNVGWWVEVSPAKQAESPVLELVSVSWQGPREGAHPAVVDLPFWVVSPESKATAEKNRVSWAVRQKGKFIRGKWEDDWPLRRTLRILFWLENPFLYPINEKFSEGMLNF